VIDWFASRFENTFFKRPCDKADAEKIYFPNQRQINNIKLILSQWRYVIKRLICRRQEIP
jgi:hypothetical protein